MTVIGTAAAGALNAAGAPSRRAAAGERAAALESYLGDPADFTNPLGHEALLAADARGELSGEGERLLGRFHLNAEFVPRRLGGRFDGPEGLVRVLRPVFRRDASLAIGYGLSSFLAAVTSWLEGAPEQQRATADLLLRGERMAVAHPELAHGNDLARDEFRATDTGTRLVLDGTKRAINNVARARALTVYARTSPAPGRRSHSVLLLDTEEIPAARLTHLPRHPTTGARGLYFHGISFNELPVARSALVGEVGQGMELALRSFQISRGVMPSTAIAMIDTCLRTAVRCADERGRASGSGIDMRNAQQVLAAALADLLLCDSLCLAATRAVNLLPEQTGVYAAAAEYLVPKVLGETAYDLSIILGSSLYDQRGPYGIFAKQVRDLPVVSLGHAGSAACQATIIPQLPLLADRAWFDAEPAPAGLFDIGGSLPQLHLEALRPAAGEDALAASLVATARERPGASAGGAAAHRLAEGFLRELCSLRARISRAGAADRTPVVVAEMSALTDRYTHVLAAASCLGVWRQQQRASPGGFLAEPAWVVTALARIAGRLGGVPGLTDHAELAAPHEERLATEVVARYRDPRGYDLYGAALAG
ncbi:hypothetical protein AQ490_20055 [Wenjunlia vitaminophila]|uniref:Acyl-CoA dehydrogenase n=1 Tax=Wenjunlia vitaminophila TaxID=76728 RepID=A3R4S2_WENVI|nr:acyl-CoA dehydrogenase family protein [Wenjunlia vitaminophila]ABO15867.1 acyl-CoA dehydrogenase [Wenjunlia vitaminophila]KRV49614.1 hypothetical protein AQ490_20055 [Wenjunlia vitaminophila]